MASVDLENVYETPEWTVAWAEWNLSHFPFSFRSLYIFLMKAYLLYTYGWNLFAKD